MLRMIYSYRVIRMQQTGEAIGIVRIPENSVVLSIWHRSGASFVYNVQITEAEYSTYEAFEAFPIYRWVSKSVALGFTRLDVALYDPKYFTARDGMVYENLN